MLIKLSGGIYGIHTTIQNALLGNLIVRNDTNEKLLFLAELTQLLYDKGILSDDDILGLSIFSEYERAE